MIKQHSNDKENEEREKLKKKEHVVSENIINFSLMQYEPTEERKNN